MDICLKEANSVLDAFKGQGIEFPRALWDKCKAVVILNEVEAGFIASGGGGAGVIVPKKHDGSWGNPCAVTVTDFSVGAVIGLTKKQIVLFPMTDPAFKMLAESKAKCQLGLNAGLAIGPVGRETAVGWDTNYNDKGDVKNTVTFSYFIEKGAWVSVAVPVTSLEHDDVANQEFYGSNVTGIDILSGKGNVEAPKGKGVEELIAKLDSFK